MLGGRSGKGVYVVLSIFVVTAVQAAPTISERTEIFSAHVPSAREEAVEDCLPITGISQLSELSNSRFANIAAEFLKPPTSSINASALPAHATSLPGVPGALFMALVGFLCVSLVKDRKLWIATLAGLLWAGQAGFTALPQLASHLVSKKQVGQQPSPNVTYARELENSDRSRCDIEGTRYIGLLHHLAGIPERKERPHVRVPARRGPKCRAKYLAPPLRRGFPLLKISQFAITHFSPLLNCPAIYLASRAKQSGCFSPAFIFDNLARGPPEQAEVWISSA